MPTNYGKKAKAKATKLHSLVVRTRDNFTCRWCGITRGEGKQIQCAHIISRSISATRTDELNALALCASCHWKQSKNPLVWARWLEQELGNEHLDYLLSKGVAGVKVDFEILVKEHAVKEAEYKKNWFKEYLAAEGAVKQKESWAGYKTSELHYETLVAEALVKAKREKLHSLRTACDALRTLAANVRSQVKF